MRRLLVDCQSRMQREHGLDNEARVDVPAEVTVSETAAEMVGASSAMASRIDSFADVAHSPG